MTSPLPIYYSRSAVTADWKCPRSRYWGYEHMGRGISPDTTALPLFLGTVVHDGLAAIANNIDIDRIITALYEQMNDVLPGGAADAEYFKAEQTALVEGQLRGFHRHVWPILQSQYPTVVCIEKEMTYEHDGLTFMAKPDLVVRDVEGNLWYLEYKTTSSSKDQWISSWSTAVQLHSSVRAVEATLGEKVMGVIVQGLYKGYVSYDKQNSPFCYAYHKPGNPPFQKAIWAYEYAAGLKRYPTWEREGGVKQWVAEMPSDMLATQFPQVPPILLNDDLIDAFFKQRAAREWDIRVMRNRLVGGYVEGEGGATDGTKMNPQERQEIMDDAFPQHFEQCSPGWGSGCSYKRLCHGSVDNPLEAGFALRHSHHQIEEDALNAS